jgi:hypothetical protein
MITLKLAGKELSIMKSGLTALVVLSLVSCTAASPQSTVAYDKGKNYSVVRTNNNTYIADVGNGKKGARFSIEIKVPESSSGFRTAANNSSGNTGKTATDIQTYQVYLIKHSVTLASDPYPLNGDPLVDLVSGPITLTNGGSSILTIAFANVPDSAGNAYYVAVRALDSGGNDLVKVNNGSTTAWTGTTAAANARVAVSTGAGIIVSSTSVVNNIASLSVFPNLLDAAGATIQTDIVPNSGSTTVSAVNAAAISFVGEFKVAAISTTSSSGSTAVAMDSSGDFVIDWDTLDQDSDSFGIYGRRYNLNGFAPVNEFQVNTTVTSVQINPSVAMDSAGDFVVAWQSYGQDGSSYGIYAKRYNAAGVVQGAEFKVNTTTANTQVNPSAAMDSSGNFVIAWQSYGQDGSGDGVYAQRYNADGTKPSTNGAEFKVNTTTANTQANPSAAMDSSGNFVIAWQSNLQDNSNFGIYAQRYNATGAAQLAEFRVNVTTVNNQKNPAAAMDGSGNFIIAWDGNGPSDSSGVFAQRYNTSGTVQVAEFRVNTQSNNAQANPAVAARDAAGNFVIAWQSSGQDGNGYGVYGQRYNAAGSVQGAEFQVNTSVSNDQKSPSIAMDGIGEFVIAWTNLNTNTGAGNTLGTYAQRYTAAGVAR